MVWQLIDLPKKQIRTYQDGFSRRIVCINELHMVISKFITDHRSFVYEEYFSGTLFEENGR